MSAPTYRNTPPNGPDNAAHAEPESVNGKQTGTAPATGRGKLLEFAMILREWDRAEKGGPNPGNVDCICQPEH